MVDFLETRPEVDAGRLALYGISQAGYWVPRALAFEHRIAAAVADPGVDDVAASWRAHLTPEQRRLLWEQIQKRLKRLGKRIPPKDRAAIMAALIEKLGKPPSKAQRE